jgi:hypothetical protein
MMSVATVILGVLSDLGALGVTAVTNAQQSQTPEHGALSVLPGLSVNAVVDA